SPETNGVLTEAALRSLQAFSRDRLIEEDSVHASEAIGDLVDALIGCRFEETQQDHDEAVRARIMHVLAACLEGGAGVWLSDEVVWAVLQTCMANLDQMSAHSPLLRMAAEESVFKVVRWLFSRLPEGIVAGELGENIGAPAAAIASPSPPPPPPPPPSHTDANSHVSGSGGGGVLFPGDKSHSSRTDAPQHQQQQ
ncbi:unnamed protein product, partial [Ectocarpus sp. 12 AP-2014]